MSVVRESPRAANQSAANGSPSIAPSPGTLIAETQVTFDGREDVAVTVVDAIATERDEPVTELVSRIDEAVDPDALNRIIRPLPDGTRRTGWVTFFLCDCLVRLHSDGRLQIFACRDGPASGTE